MHPEKPGKRDQTDFRHREPARLKSFSHARVNRGIRCGQNPRCVDEFDRIYLATAAPSTVHIRNNNQRILEQDFYVQILLIYERSGYSCEDEIMLSLTQGGEVAAGRGHFVKTQRYARILPAEAFDSE